MKYFEDISVKNARSLTGLKAQRQLRMRLKQEKAAIKNQLNKLTERPTLC